MELNIVSVVRREKWKLNSKDYIPGVISVTRSNFLRERVLLGLLSWETGRWGPTVHSAEPRAPLVSFVRAAWTEHHTRGLKQQKCTFSQFWRQAGDGGASRAVFPLKTEGRTRPRPLPASRCGWLCSRTPTEFSPPASLPPCLKHPSV